jgi:subtilisin family serine protease
MSRVFSLMLGALVVAGSAVCESRVNVVFKPGTSALEKDAALLRSGAARICRIRELGIVTAIVPGAASRKALQLDPTVVLVEEDAIIRAISNDGVKSQDLPGDPAIEQLLPTGVDRIEAEPGVSPATGASAVVAIVDTGIQRDHDDLTVSDGIHFYSIATGPPSKRAKEDGAYDDDHGHGTHVAGTVAALDNGFGVVGVAPAATLLAVKVLNSEGSGYTSDVARGIVWAADNGADVINMSLSGPGTDTLRDAVGHAADKGVLMACASGNDYGKPVSYPAAYPECIAVSAWTDLDGTPDVAPDVVSPWGDPDESLASFSNVGPETEVTAPGVEIFSTWMGNGYDTKSGTSMAAPHVAGVLALLIDQDSVDPRTDLALTAESPLYVDPTTQEVEYSANEVGSGLVRASAPPPPNDAPVVSISSPADGSTFDSGALIQFTGTASDAEDGDLTASIVWTSDLQDEIGTGGNFAAVLVDGAHVITASVTDSGGKTSTATVSIHVGDLPTEPTVVSVDSITYRTQGGRFSDRDLVLTVALVDDLGGPVEGASVSIDISLNGSPDSYGTGSTEADGTVSFLRKRAPSGTYETVVTNVVADGLTWDGQTPEDNTYTK